MKAASIYNLIFSSSATVYGNPKSLPLREDAIRSAMSPYGRSKLMIEDILEDLHHAEPDWNIARLRYFNPVGAHESGLIGELPKDIPNNLMPYIQQVAHGLQPYLKVFGDDYNTSDGTGIRDYVHVMDLAEGHVTALHYFQNNKGLLTVNLGTGKGTSVFELIKTFEEVNHCHVPYRVVARRKGDVAACWADVEYAAQTLQWKAKRDVSDMCKDSWRFECNRNQFSKE
jgi:UDP-glucose 4-epimerase